MTRAVVAALVLLLAGCVGSDAPSPTGGMGSIPRCSTIEPVAARAELYRDSPIYVANEMPVEELRAWAASKPGFEEIWIDRDHLGWITLAFSRDAEARQAELEQRYPDVGAVVVPVDWTAAELQRLQERVQAELSFEVGSSADVRRGVVEILVGILKPERVVAVEAAFAGERVCIEGIDPADAPAEGPQQPAGDGWRLLLDRPKVGDVYRTGIATDAESYAALWNEIGVSDELPTVDFSAEVVIWFGAVYGSSCPDLRLDDVVADMERRLLYAVIVLVGSPMACTADANPRAYVVAVDRAKLPKGPFSIQLGPDDPPAGFPGERTNVDVDLSVAGAVAHPDQLWTDPPIEVQRPLEPGAFLEPGFPNRFRLSVHCGVEWLGPLNDVFWRTEVPPNAPDFVPPEWQSAVRDGAIELDLLLDEGPPPTIAASANSHTLVYEATATAAPGCD